MNDCVFCKIIKGEIPCDKVYEDNQVIAFLDISPVNPGHTLVIPKKHYETIIDVPTKILHKTIDVAQKVAKALVVTPDGGVNVFQNNKPAAGQLVPHIHFHLIPRHSGDGHTFTWKEQGYESDAQKEEYRKCIEKALK